MASQYIKIFNDTVLKQSILQGYEYQRQNPNLGKFTSGELAFTRDTGRVFVGNYSDDPKNNDLETVDGGILIGNKYLGIIDSRPIAYNQDETTGTTGLAGLSYEENNEEEYALFTINTRTKKKGKTNDWNNDPSFNSNYGTYNGDYLYDVWRNALIIFDNNIKPNSDNIKVSNPFTSNEKVYDNLNNDITKSGKLRTPLNDLTNNDIMKDYPIYGNGYVIFRLIEPDGKTIRFQPRDITSIQNEKPIGNWTHNILEVNFSADNIFGVFDTDTFKSTDEKIFIKNLKLEPNSAVKLPSVINFTSPDDKNIEYDFVSKLHEDLISSTPSSETNYILGYTYETISGGNNGVKFKQIDTTALNGLITKQDLKITILTPENGKLKVNNGHISTGTSFTLSLEEEEVVEIQSGTPDPWDCNASGQFHYTGNYNDGKLISINDYSPTFSDRTSEDENGNETTVTAQELKTIFKNTLNQFIANVNTTSTSEEIYNCNVGLNYLKTPYTLSGLTTSEKLISKDSIADITSSSGLRLIPDHAESIIVLITTPNETSEVPTLETTEVSTLSIPAEVSVTNCSTPIFKSSQPNFTTTVEIPLIPKSVEEKEGNETFIETYKTFSFSIKNCSAKLLGYRL